MKITRLSAALASFAICACTSDGETSNSEALGSARVALVNGRPVPESVVRIYALATERQNLDEMSPEDRARIVNDVVGLELLAQQAEKEGLTSSRTLAAQLELQRMQSLARSMASDYIEKNPPTDAAIQAIYEENLPRLAGEQHRLRHILVTSKAEADTVIAQLNQGADFIELAEQRAEGPTGPNGGALGWLSLDSMPPPFAAAVQDLNVGSYSREPVQTDAGYHVILLEETQRQPPPAMEEIRDDLAAAAERKQLDDYIKTLRDSATVSIEP